MIKERAISILPANVVLLCLGFADLMSTLWWLHTGKAIEVNPIMAAVLKLGIPFFVFVKLLTLTAYVGVIEWYRRRRNPLIANRIGLFTASAYAAIYTVCFTAVNYRCLL